MKINWTRRNKLFAGVGGVLVVLVAVVLVFTFVGMPGGGKLFGASGGGGIQYVQDIYNNTGSTVYILSLDSEHNGALRGGGDSFTLDDGKWHALKPYTHYQADWFGIPWYWYGRHYKLLSDHMGGGVKFYNSEQDGKAWIYWEDADKGHTLGRQEVPAQGKVELKLIIDEKRVHLEAVNDSSVADKLRNEAIEAAGKAVAETLEAGAKLAEIVASVAGVMP